LGGRWKRSSMPSWIIRQPAMRRWQLYAPPVASCRSRCPTSLMGLGPSPLRVHRVDNGSPYPLALSFGRILTHLHSFYDEGQALPKHNTAPQLGFPGSTPKRDNCPVVMGSRSTMSGESSGQMLTSPTTCHQVSSGFAMDGGRDQSSHIW